MIVVVNVKSQNSAYEYIGRSPQYGGPSPLGNPYRLNRDGDRQQVIALYRRWLWWSVIQNRQQPAYGELLRLADIAASGDLILGCHCAPAACHGDVMQGAIEWINRERGADLG